MEAQKPAQGILLHRDYGDAKHYTITCDCLCDDHSQHLWVEAEDTGITATVSTQVKTKWWSMNRWKQIWTLLTKGYIEMEGATILNRQQALNYAEVLKQAVTDVEEFRKNRKGSKNAN